MLYRRCAAGEDIAIYFGSIFVQAVRDARSHPSRRYVVWAHGSAVLETDVFTEAEAAYIAECNKVHTSIGAQIPGKHKLRNGVVQTV
jgi:hypothetical protein